MPPGHVSKENARTEWINCAVLISGEKPGRGTIFLHLIRILGEISRTSNTPWQCFGRFSPKTVPRCIARGVIEVGATRYWAFRVAPSTPGRIRGLLLGAACEGATKNHTFRVAPGRYDPVRQTVSQQNGQKAD